MAIVCLMFFICCKSKVEPTPALEAYKKEDHRNDSIPPIENAIGTTILSRFSPPQGFIRKEIENKSFASYLRNFQLLDSGEPVYLYNGHLKGNQSAHVAILDIDVGDRDLQQCADAIIRLRAEYLLGQNKHDEIAFNFTNGWRFEYSKWRKGNNLVVNGNRTKWEMGVAPKENYEEFRAYLDEVFMYAGTLSLSKELKPKKIEDIEIGDVFIYGGSPGHAVLVVDLAVNEMTGDKAFMLAQSYMPAQQIHVLRHNENSIISPWYLLSEIGSAMYTPEWTFDRGTLKGF